MSSKKMDEGYDIERTLKGKIKGGHLEKWALHEVTNDRQIVWGTITGDDRFRDGDRIHTSLVLAVHEDANILETRNTYYTLGEPAEVQVRETAEKVKSTIKG